MRSKAAEFSSGVLPDGEFVFSILESAFDDANSGIAIFDPSGALRYLNPEMRTLLGIGDTSLVALSDLTPEDRTGRPYLDFERFRVGRIPRFRSCHQLRRADGTLVWADVSARRRRFDDIKRPLIIVEIIDTTAEIEAEAALDRDAARWETALDAGRQGVWEFDNTTQTLIVTKGWRRLRGIGPDVPVSRDYWLSHVHPEDQERINRTSREQGEVDGFDTIEYRERLADGQYMWIYSRGRPYQFDADGVPLRGIGTDTDITRLKTVEAELALEKERLQVTLQSIADGVISTDATSRITFINKAAKRMTGRRAETALGQPIETVFDSHLEGQADMPTASVAQCIRHGRAYRHAGYSMLKGKRSRYLHEMASPLRTESGDVIGAVLVFRDATQHRKLMRELEYSASHDALTDLGNRMAFEADLARSVQRTTTGDRRDVLCLIDLDHFKAVNDGAGHSAGDDLLKKIAKLLQSSCRAGDCVSRLGGDEFGIVLKDCDVKTARCLMQTIARRISGLGFTWLNESFHVGASIGVTAIDGSVANASELYRSADNACYAAKRNGRGCVVVAG